MAARTRTKQSLPKLSGDVTLKSFPATRARSRSGGGHHTLTKRGHRTSFESYDPENDMLELEVRIRESKPLEIDNILVEAKLDIEDTESSFPGPTSASA